MPIRGYKDFNLAIRIARDGKSYHAEVVESAGGDGNAIFTREELPLDPLPTDSDSKDARHLSIAAPGAAKNAFLGTRSPPNREVAQSYGERLFDAVFKGTLRDCLVKSRVSAIKDKSVLRLRLFLKDVPELGVLPWEYLFSRDFGLFFGYDNRPYTAIVRYLNLAEEIEDLTVKSPLRVLVMISKPSDANQLKVDLEWQQLLEALAELREQKLLELELLPQATLAALDERLSSQPEDRPFHIFHFIGHGLFDPDEGAGKLLLEDEAGRGEAVSGETLGVALRGYGLRLAVINACEGARIAATDSYQGLAPCLLRNALIPAVVAMQFKITDLAAISFAQHFYHALADGRAVDVALTQARRKMFLDKHQVEWAVPVLYMRTKNSYLLEPTSSREDQTSVVVTVEPQSSSVTTGRIDPLEEHYQSVIEALRDGQLVPFLGLDVNLFGRERVASWRPGSTLPASQELAGYLAEQFKYPAEKLSGSRDLLEVAQYVAVKGNLGKLYGVLGEIFGGVQSPTPLHNFFARLPQLLLERGYPLKKDPLRKRLVIVTTGYDGLLEAAFNRIVPGYHVVSYVAKGGDQGRFLHSRFSHATRQFTEVITDGSTYRAFAQDEDYEPVILKLPGSLDQADADHRFSVAITEDQYFDYLTRRELSVLLPAELTSKLRWSSHLFMGYSMREWNLRALIFRIWDEQRPSYTSWAIQNGGEESENQFWRACGVEPVAADLPDYLTGLSERLERMAPAGGSA